MSTFNYNPIGLINTPHKKRKNMPIQPPGAKCIKGQIVLDPVFVDGIKDLDGFSHIILLYAFDRSDGYSLQTMPFLENIKRGLFSTRAPRRPNAIGLSVVKLTGINGNIIDIENVDMLDQTPLLDIKPFVDVFDCPDEPVKIGWLANRVKQVHDKRSDERFL